MMVKASREGILKANPNKRPFILSRSIYTGGQKYAASWTGDNVATWEHLKMSIPMSINLGLSGMSFNGPDIGGFVGDATPELFAHWISLGAFYPFSRAHTGKGTKAHEPWAFDQEVENAARYAMQRRYRLLPYLYTLFHESSVNGMPIMRPTFFADPKNTGLRREQASFLVGADLMVIPKWAKYTAMPAGNWRSIKLLVGDKEEDGYQPTLKLRPGAILPISNIIQSTVDYSLKEIKLIISLDEKGNAKGVLYHDAGDGFGYKNGKYSMLEFSAETKSDKLEIKTNYIKKGFDLKNKVVRVEVYTDKGVVTGKGDLNKSIIIDL
jgi:alpha-glucosidase